MRICQGFFPPRDTVVCCEWFVGWWNTYWIGEVEEGWKVCGIKYVYVFSVFSDRSRITNSISMLCCCCCCCWCCCGCAVVVVLMVWRERRVIGLVQWVVEQLSSLPSFVYVEGKISTSSAMCWCVVVCLRYHDKLLLTVKMPFCLQHLRKTTRRPKGKIEVRSIRLQKDAMNVSKNKQTLNPPIFAKIDEQTLHEIQVFDIKSHDVTKGWGQIFISDPFCKNRWESFYEIHVFWHKISIWWKVMPNTCFWGQMLISEPFLQKSMVSKLINYSWFLPQISLIIHKTH